MPLTVTMPQLGESVTEGTIARWLKQPGDAIAKYESIAEVITDKVNAEIPAPADGVMAQVIAPEGTVVPVGQPICSIETSVAVSADAALSGPAAGVASAPAQAEPSAPATAPAMSPPQTAQPELAASTPPQAQPAQPAPATPEPVAAELAATAQRQSSDGHMTSSAESSDGNGSAAGYHLTPAVRMLVREHGVDLREFTGSGLGGRITKKDVLEYVQRRDAGSVRGQVGASAPATPPAMSPPQMPQPALATPSAAAAPTVPTSSLVTGAVTPGEGDTVVPLSQVRRSIAEHMVRSRQTSPHAYVMVEVDMSAVSRIRDREKAAFEQRQGVKLTFLPFVARAVIEALQRFPTLNASWSDAGIVLKRDINLGIAVALEDNLIVPVVRNADRLSITGLATTMADLGARARSNHLKLDEIQGGTFTLNNTGALGAVMTQAIINQPQAAILTMDMVVKRPVVVGDAIAIRPVMNLGLSFDHRINDGLPATRFITTVQQLLESLDPSGTLV